MTELIRTSQSWDGAELPDYLLSQKDMPLAVQHPEIPLELGVPLRGSN